MGGKDYNLRLQGSKNSKNEIKDKILADNNYSNRNLKTPPQ